MSAAMKSNATQEFARVESKTDQMHNRVAIIYETSYLLKYGETKPFVPEHFDDLVLEHIVPVEVKEEIKEKRADQSIKDQVTSATKAIAALMNPVEPAIFSEPILSRECKPIDVGSTLGASSGVEQLILGYCETLLSSENYLAVLLATDRGGLMVDVARIQKEYQLPIYIISNPSELRNAKPFQECRQDKREKQEQSVRRKLWLSRLMQLIIAILFAIVVTYSYKAYPWITLGVTVVGGLLLSPFLIEWFFQRNNM
jgi:hypothetical protein